MRLSIARELHTIFVFSILPASTVMVFRSFQILVFSILVTVKTVIWALLLLLVIIYMFALVLREGVGTYIDH